MMEWLTDPNMSVWEAAVAGVVAGAIVEMVRWYRNRRRG